jgi:hypothetical protein
MKKNTVIIILVCIIATVLTVFFAWQLIAGDYSSSLENDKTRITNMIKIKYTNYKIKDLKLEYVDFYSTVSEANEYHKATEATVIIENDVEERTLHFRKRFFVWLMDGDSANYGPDIPNGLYFVELDYVSLGKKVDIDKYLSEWSYWVIPNKKGTKYEKVGGEDWYYSVLACKNIYKTQDGYVYIFNKNNAYWEISSLPYADLLTYGNYTKIDKKDAINLIKENSPYEGSD